MTAITRPLCAHLLAGVAFVLGLVVTAHATAGPTELRARLDRLEIDVVRAEDIRAIKKLQRAYGYYADRGLWDDLADLFTDDAVANYPSGGFDGNASIRAMFIQNLGQGKRGLAEGRIYNHTILQPVVDLAPDGATATGRWRVLGMLGRFGASASWADSLYRFDYVKQHGHWKIQTLIAYAGSGAGYDQGWVAPKPRPPGYIDTSPVRFNLAHPADRPWTDPCEADTSACVVPFPYSNRGKIARSAKVSAVITPAASLTISNGEGDRATDLIHRAQRLENQQEVLNLQDAYGYYLDRGLWKEAAGLFATAGTLEVGQAGVYVGREHIRRSLALSGPRGLRAGQLNDHLQIEPIVDVAPDGQTAKARIFELAFLGGGGSAGRIVQSVEEVEYVRRAAQWMIQSLHDYTILATDYNQGWAKSALPPPATNALFPPDRPPTVVYSAYPKIYTPPLHFDNASTGNPTQYRTGSPVPAPSDGGTAPSSVPPKGFRDLEVAIGAGEHQMQRVRDYDEIENLQNAYGYYAEKSLWSDIAALFVDAGEFDVDGIRSVGRKNILAALQASGPEGPVKGELNSQLQLQPVIHIASDGRTAKIRSRLLNLTRDAHGRPMWGSGIYENEVVKEQGVWKFERLHLYWTWKVYYKGGWASPGSDEGQLLPSRFTPPFHYRHPDGR